MEYENDNAKLTRVPFRLEEKMIVVEARINGEVRDFYLDTGAPSLVLNTDYSSGRKTEGMDGIEGDLQTDRSIHVDFSWTPRIALSGETTVVEMAAGEDKPKIAGLIGYEVLKEFDVLLDYGNRELILADPLHSRQAFGTDENRITVVPFKMHRHLPVVKGSIGEVPFRLGLDSGADTNLLSQNCESVLDGVLEDPGYELLRGAGDRQEWVRNGRIGSVRIGPKEFSDLSAVVGSVVHLNRHAEVRIDGIVGYEVLSRQKTMIRYPAKEIWFIDE